MTRNRWEEDPATIAEAERFYSFVGQYVISFQWLEGQIDQILLLARGHDHWDETHQWLSGLRNVDKIHAFRDVVDADEPFDRVPIEGWYDRFDQAIDRLHTERQRRNGILHAQFLFDFLAIGQPVMRLDVRRRGGDVEYTQEDLSQARCDEIMNELAQLGVDLNFICVQLRHVYRQNPPPLRG
ncbi:hypothetical protein [Eilatimonas milleporae]|uniref:Uncharacterized protein n=1 Tax=Eilatimonas milleporae TaxID=911205 RepID=A0A3M0C025_9PROT|nr:hypothetical protein [Eilatimonas milleporae]RMB01977.1 hypothetical protein BXY39_3487 [Eilatimonas milleporae]